MNTFVASKSSDIESKGFALASDKIEESILQASPGVLKSGKHFENAAPGKDAPKPVPVYNPYDDDTGYFHGGLNE